MTLSELARRGLRLELLAPADARLLDLQLMRVQGKRQVRALSGRVVLRKGGPIDLRWKPGSRAVSRLKSGSYVLRVRVGPDAKRLSGASAQAKVRLTGRLPGAAQTGTRR